MVVENLMQEIKRYFSGIDNKKEKEEEKKLIEENLDWEKIMGELDKLSVNFYYETEPWKRFNLAGNALKRIKYSLKNIKEISRRYAIKKLYLNDIKMLNEVNWEVLNIEKNFWEQSKRKIINEHPTLIYG